MRLGLSWLLSRLPEGRSAVPERLRDPASWRLKDRLLEAASCPDSSSALKLPLRAPSCVQRLSRWFWSSAEAWGQRT